MNPPDRTLLLSIHPHFARKIFGGSKTVELRRTRPRVGEGDVVAIYVTSPTKEIQGFSRVQRVSQKPPAELWDEVHGRAGVNRSEFESYFQGANQAVGIHLDTSCRLIRPIKLCDIRNAWEGFHPPQSFRYLSSPQLQTILNVHKENAWRTSQPPATPVS